MPAQQHTSLSPSTTTTSPTTKTASTHALSLLHTAAFADSTVRCGQHTWRVHRAILAPRCRFFAACFDGRFAESASGANEICLSEDRPDAVAGLLGWLYALEWPEADAEADGQQQQHQQQDGPLFGREWTHAFRMHAIADKYDAPDLLALARQRLLSLSSSSSTAFTASTFLSNLPAFTALIDELYDTPSPAPDATAQLRVEVLAPRLAGLVAGSVRREPAVAELVGGYPEFAVDLLEAVALGREMEMEMERLGSARGVNLKDGEKAGSPGVVHIPMNEDSESEWECD